MRPSSTSTKNRKGTSPTQHQPHTAPAPSPATNTAPATQTRHQPQTRKKPKKTKKAKNQKTRKSKKAKSGAIQREQQTTTTQFSSQLLSLSLLLLHPSRHSLLLYSLCTVCALCVCTVYTVYTVLFTSHVYTYTLPSSIATLHAPPSSISLSLSLSLLPIKHYIY